ncbi:MAG: hypothetical protein LBR26_12800 [Prevotella sp.]|nr:hypothetical protein [Prevotella sp.]
MIIEHKPSAILTPENIFLEIAKKQVTEDVVLHPDMTCLVKYRESSLIKMKEEEKAKRYIEKTLRSLTS